MLIFIAPYRASDQPERLHQLQLFVHTIKCFLPNAYIFIVEQYDNKPFNRGGLLNIGVSVCGSGREDVLCFHNLNILPTTEVIQEYGKPLPPKTVRHIRSTNSHEKLGGVILMRSGDFHDINGFPNDYWGCGGEDDELHYRILSNDMRIERVEGTMLQLNKLQPPSPTSAIPNNRWERCDWHRAHPGEQGLGQIEEKILRSDCCDPKMYHYQVQISNSESPNSS